jgi:opacity protein-like surface antigen
MRFALLAALAFLPMTASSFAQGLPEDVTKTLSCGVIFALKGQSSTGSPEEAAEWNNRGDELTARGRAMLEAEGYQAAEIDAAVDSTAISAGFMAGTEFQDFSDEDCFSLIE